MAFLTWTKWTVSYRRAPRRRPGAASTLAAALALSLLASPSPSVRATAGQPAGDERVFQPVKRGDLIQTLTERGELEPRHAEDVLCRAHARGANRVAATIKWLVEDGSLVKTGDRVAELDDSSLQEELRQRTVAVVERQAAWVQAKLELRIAETVGGSDLQTAEGNVEVAELDLKKHRAGERRHQRKLELQLSQAKATLALRKLQATGDHPPADAKLALQLAEGEVELADLDLQGFLEGVSGERRKPEVQVRQARSALEVAKLHAAGQKAQAEARLQTARALLEAEKARLNDVKEDVARCVLTAPGPGLVRYTVPENVRFGTSPTVAVGEPAREGQSLLRIADLSQMEVRTRVHEALVARLRPAREDDPASRGQEAQVRVDALQRTLPGHVRAVASAPAAGDWLSPDVKMYPTFVTLDRSDPRLKPGMSADVSIILGERKNVLFVPVQSVWSEGASRFCYVKSGDDVEKRALTLGVGNDQQVEIRDGLREGEEVLVNPRTGRAAKGGAGDGQARRPGAADVLVRSVKPADENPIAQARRIEKYGLTFQDLGRLQTLDTVARVVPLRTFPTEVRRLEHVFFGRVVATRATYAELYPLRLAAGRFLTDEDDAQKVNVAVLGASVAERLFPIEEPLGQTVRLGRHAYMVVGVLGERRPVGRGKALEVFNSDVYIPLQTSRARFGERIAVRAPGSFRVEQISLSRILVTVRDPAQARATAAVIASQLRHAHGQTDWEVVSPGDGPG